MPSFCVSGSHRNRPTPRTMAPSEPAMQTPAFWTMANLASASQRFMGKALAPRSSWKWTSTRVITRAEKTEVRMPMARVTAKPRTGPVPTFIRIRAVRSVVTLASMMADRACLKPFWADCRALWPFSASSRIRSKIRMLASTAMPTVRMIPAMPGRVRVACRKVMAPISMTRLATRLTAA